MNASVLGFLAKLLLASAAISLLIKIAGPLLELSEVEVSNGTALAIVLSLPTVLGGYLLLRWQQKA